MPNPTNDIKFKRVALRYQRNNIRAIDSSGVLLAYLKSRNIDIDILHADPEPCEVHAATLEEDQILDKVDLVISLGGDGTYLSTSRLASRKGIPVFGVHLGHLGFLTEVSLENALTGLERVLKGDYFIEERMLIETDIDFNGEKKTFRALNDIVIHRVSFSRMIAIEVFVNENPIVSYEADGIIVATPTGSTAYSLASGGSILWPDLDAFIITPICPHTLSSRPLIVPADKIIQIHCPTAYKSAVSVNFDGQQWREYNYPVAFNLRKSEIVAKLVRIGKRRFGEILRDKLNWGKTFR